MSQHTDSRKRQKIYYICTQVIIVAFVVLFLFKINGYWDTSSNYHMQSIVGSIDEGDPQAVIDKDELTTWGDGDYWEDFKVGTYLRFTFDRPVTIESLEIKGTYPDDIVISYKQDGEWIPLENVQQEEDTFVFSKPITAKRLQLSTGEEATRLKWKVKEIEFNERED